MLGFVTEGQAMAFGCTHRASLFGLLPGFVGNIDSGEPTWVARHPLLDVVADYLLSPLYVLACEVSGNEPMFSFAVGRELH